MSDQNLSVGFVKGLALFVDQSAPEWWPCGECWCYWWTVCELPRENDSEHEGTDQEGTRYGEISQIKMRNNLIVLVFSLYCCLLFIISREMLFLKFVFLLFVIFGPTVHISSFRAFHSSVAENCKLANHWPTWHLFCYQISHSLHEKDLAEVYPQLSFYESLLVIMARHRRRNVVISSFCSKNYIKSRWAVTRNTLWVKKPIWKTSRFSRLCL